MSEDNSVRMSLNPPTTPTIPTIPPTIPPTTEASVGENPGTNTETTAKEDTPRPKKKVKIRGLRKRRPGGII